MQVTQIDSYSPKNEEKKSILPTEWLSYNSWLLSGVVFSSLFVFKVVFNITYTKWPFFHAGQRSASVRMKNVIRRENFSTRQSNKSSVHIVYDNRIVGFQ